MPINDQNNLAANEPATSHVDFYKVNATDDPITVSVYPGPNGMLSQTDISVDATAVVSNGQGSISGCALGSGNSLRGKYLTVVTIINTIGGNAQDTNFRLGLTGGVNPYNYYVVKTVPDAGGAVIYRATIFFTIH